MWAQRFWRSGCSKVDGGSEFPARSPTLKEQWCPIRPMWLPGSSVSLALGIRCPQSPALWNHAIEKGPSGADLGLE